MDSGNGEGAADLRERVRGHVVTQAPYLNAEIKRPVFVPPALLTVLPVPKIEETLGWFEKLINAGAAGARAVALVAEWTPLAINILIKVITMDFKGIIKCLVAIILAALTKWLGIGQDTELLGFRLDVIIEWVLIFIGGWFLPQLRSLLPEWARGVFGGSK